MQNRTLPFLYFCAIILWSISERGGKVMVKLKTRTNCIKSINKASTVKMSRSSAHQILVDEANKKIAKNRMSYATAHARAGEYFSN